MPRVLILAYGNPLRCDDGVAWRAAELLRAQLTAGDAEIITAHQLTPELAERAAQADQVIFVDAAGAGIPGQVCVAPVSREEAGENFSHWLTPAQLVALAAALYGASPQAFVVSIAGEDFGHGEALSSVVRAALPQLVARVMSLAASP